MGHSILPNHCKKMGMEIFWMGGVRLVRFDPKLVAFRYFDEQDGLQSNSFKIWSSYKLRSGELVFGGINGFTIFAPPEF